MKNLWRDIEPYNDDNTWNAVVEIPNGSQNKYELNLKRGKFELEKKLLPEQTFIFDYGFIPQTLGGDGDPLDVIILSERKLNQGDIIRTTPIALMRMLDEGEVDDKIIALEAGDDYWRKNLNNDIFAKAEFKKIEKFFKKYKQLERTKLEINGFGSRQEAIKTIKKGINRYKKHNS